MVINLEMRLIRTEPTAAILFRYHAVNGEIALLIVETADHAIDDDDP